MARDTSRERAPRHVDDGVLRRSTGGRERRGSHRASPDLLRGLPRPDGRRRCSRRPPGCGTDSPATYLGRHPAGHRGATTVDADAGGVAGSFGMAAVAGTSSRSPCGSARRLAPVARRAAVCALALLTVPLLIIISVSRSAPDPFDRVDDSGHRSQTFGAARALARVPGHPTSTQRATVDTVGAVGTVGTAGTGVPCAGGDPGCPAGESAAVPQHLCAAPAPTWRSTCCGQRPGPARASCGSPMSAGRSACCPR